MQKPSCCDRGPTGPATSPPVRCAEAAQAHSLRDGFAAGLEVVHDFFYQPLDAIERLGPGGANQDKMAALPRSLRRPCPPPTKQPDRYSAPLRSQPLLQRAALAGLPEVGPAHALQVAEAYRRGRGSHGTVPLLILPTSPSTNGLCSAPCQSRPLPAAGTRATLSGRLLAGGSTGRKRGGAAPLASSHSHLPSLNCACSRPAVLRDQPVARPGPAGQVPA